MGELVRYPGGRTVGTSPEKKKEKIERIS